MHSWRPTHPTKPTSQPSHQPTKTRLDRPNRTTPNQPTHLSKPDQATHQSNQPQPTNQATNPPTHQPTSPPSQTIPTHDDQLTKKSTQQTIGFAISGSELGVPPAASCPTVSGGGHTRIVSFLVLGIQLLERAAFPPVAAGRVGGPRASAERWRSARRGNAHAFIALGAAGAAAAFIAFMAFIAFIALAIAMRVVRMAGGIG